MQRSAASEKMCRASAANRQQKRQQPSIDKITHTHTQICNRNLRLNPYYHPLLRRKVCKLANLPTAADVYLVIPMMRMRIWEEDATTSHLHITLRTIEFVSSITVFCAQLSTFSHGHHHVTRLAIHQSIDLKWWCRSGERLWLARW